MNARPGTDPPGIGALVAPLDRSLARMLSSLPAAIEVRRLRWFWLDSLFSTVSVSFYASFVPLFALAYGANNAQIGQLTAVASVCGLIALLPGAQAIKLMKGRRKAVVLLFGGGVARVAILAWLIVPFVRGVPGAAVIIVIIAVNAVMTFAAYFANPAWTAIVADIVPREIRARFFSHRNFAVNIPALLVVPLAGLLIQAGNTSSHPLAGYQLVFALALVTGAISTYAFSRIDDPLPPEQASHTLPAAELIRTIYTAPSFVGLVVCTLIWNLGVQMVSPFLNVYLVNNLGASTAMVGYVAAASSLAAILTQQWVGRWVDRKGNIWVQGCLSFIIAWIPIAWTSATAAWQVVLVNAVAGILWTGHGLASFNLLLDLAPMEARAEANALFQLVIVGSAAIAPVVGGHLADLFGYRPMFVLSTVLRLLGAVAFLWLVARPAAQRARRLARADH
jgi:MFS family permease